MSQSKSSIVRKVGVERREESSIASRPFAKRDSSSSASTSMSEGMTPRGCRSEKSSERTPRPSGVSSVSRVGRSGSSTSSPPFDQRNGATRISVGSIPSP